MLVYFVRHGETVDNKVHRMQTPETVLSPDGEMQAAKLAERLQDVPFTHFLTSPYTRAKVTAETIIQYHDLALEIEPNLRELDRPSILRGKIKGQPETEPYLSYILEDHMDPDLAHEDGESYAQMVGRVDKVIQHLEKIGETQPDATVGVASHGLFVTTIMLRLVLGPQAEPSVLLQGLFRLKLSNTALSLAEYKNPDWKVYSIGDYSHL